MRRILNLKYNSNIKKHRVEIYFQEFSEPHKSSGYLSCFKKTDELNFLKNKIH